MGVNYPHPLPVAGERGKNSDVGLRVKPSIDMNISSKSLFSKLFYD